LDVIGDDLSYKKTSNFGIIEVGQKFMKPSEAMDHSTCWIDFTEAEGRIAADYIKVYPPSIPIVVPGEKITQEIIGIIKQMREYTIHGLKDDKISVIE
jgi:arginine/lysine/ornithine decarboxylase